jgi:hypothetical protein
MADTRKNLLLVTHVPSHPTIAGNRIRAVTLAPFLRELGFNIHFLYQDYIGGDLEAMREFWGRECFHHVTYRTCHPEFVLKRLVRKLRLNESKLLKSRFDRPLRLADPNRVRPGVDALYDRALDASLLRLHARHQFQAVIAQFVIMSQALESFSSPVRRILDVQEVFAVGREEQAARGERMWVDLTPQEELRGLARADFLWAAQDQDAALLRQHLGEKSLMLGHFAHCVADVKPLPARGGVLFVGAKHRANVEGLEWFGREVYPLMAGWLPPERVVIAGNVSDVLGDRLPFRFLGPVPDLAPLHREARLCVSPIISGTGLKSKNMDAFGASTPVVSTAFGRMGMEAADGGAQLVADSPEDFAEACRRLFEDDALCRRMSAAALEYARSWNVLLRDRLRVSLGVS